MDFQKFDKIPRLSRDIVITEKIDGTNAQIFIVSYESLFNSYNLGDIVDQSVIDWTHGDINNFIDKYCLSDLEDQKKKGLYEDMKDQLFIFAGSRKKWLDVSSKGDNFGFAKWVEANAEELIKLGEGKHYGEYYGKGIQRNYGLDEKRFALFNVGKWEDPELRPKCCNVVPILYRGMFDTEMIGNTLMTLKEYGSKIVEGFMNPEGIIIYHTASGKLYKKTIHNDEKPKEQVKKKNYT